MLKDNCERNISLLSERLSLFIFSKLTTVFAEVNWLLLASSLHAGLYPLFRQLVVPLFHSCQIGVDLLLEATEADLVGLCL